LQGHALPQLGLGTAIGDKGFIRPAQHVDESRRYRQAAGVDFQPGRGPLQIAKGSDPIASDCDITDERPGAASVIKGSAAQDHVVRFGRFCFGLGLACGHACRGYENHHGGEDQAFFH
jgi:hypothetical protein